MIWFWQSTLVSGVVYNSKRMLNCFAGFGCNFLSDTAGLSLSDNPFGRGKQKHLPYKCLWKMNRNGMVLLSCAHQTAQHSNKDLSLHEQRRMTSAAYQLSEETLGYGHVLQFGLMEVSLSDWVIAQRASDWNYLVGISWKHPRDMMVPHLRLLYW